MINFDTLFIVFNVDNNRPNKWLLHMIIWSQYKVQADAAVNINIPQVPAVAFPSAQFRRIWSFYFSPVCLSNHG